MNIISDTVVGFEPDDTTVPETLRGRVFMLVKKRPGEKCAFERGGEACISAKRNGICPVEGMHFVLASSDEAPVSPKTGRPVKFKCSRCGARGCSDAVRVTVAWGPSGHIVRNWCQECAGNHTVRCTVCGETMDKSSAVAVEMADGRTEYRCNAHLDGLNRCSTCGAYRESSAGYTEVAGVSGRMVKVCRACIETETALCHVCGKRHMKRAMVELDGHKVCVACRDAAPRCARCGNPTLRPQGRMRGIYCQACVDSGACSPVLGYHGFDTSRFTFFKTGADQDVVSTPLYLGFELEAGKATSQGALDASLDLTDLDPEKKRFHLERDGSIPEHGFELVSSPHTLAAHREYDWKRVLEIMKSGGLKSHDCNGECGLHVHVSKNFLSETDMVKLDAFISRNKVFWEKIARRSEVHHAVYANKQPDQLGRGASRYSAINFCPSKTVEFRLYRGSLNFSTLMATLELTDAVCRWIKTRPVDRILVNDGETAAFVAWIKERPESYPEAVGYMIRREALNTDGEV